MTFAIPSLRSERPPEHALPPLRGKGWDEGHPGGSRDQERPSSVRALKGREGLWKKAGFVLAALLPLFLALPAHALDLDLSAIDGVLGGGGASVSGRVIQGIVILTVLSVAPGVLIMVTCFTRIVVVLSLLRSALGLQQTPPNVVLLSLALFLTLHIMTPVFDQAWRDGVRPMLNEEVTQEQGLERSIEPFRDFMASQVRDKDLTAFAGFSAKAGEQPAPVTADKADLRLLTPAFMLSELRRAFEIGFLVFLPFLVIDMVVAAILMAMGMMMLPPTMIALPFKIIFFVLTDGWFNIAGSLIRSFGAS